MDYDDLSPLGRIRTALHVFDSCTPPRSHVEALDLVAEVRQALGGHHVAYPENEGDPRYDRTAYAEQTEVEG